jgi:hypothetical protein
MESASSTLTYRFHFMNIVGSQGQSVWQRAIRAGRPGFYCRQGKEMFLCYTVSRSVLGPMQPPIKLVTAALSQGVKWPGREDDRPPPSAADIKKCRALPPLTHTP